MAGGVPGPDDLELVHRIRAQLESFRGPQVPPLRYGLQLSVELVVKGYIHSWHGNSAPRKNLFMKKGFPVKPRILWSCVLSPCSKAGRGGEIGVDMLLAIMVAVWNINP